MEFTVSFINFMLLVCLKQYNSATAQQFHPLILSFKHFIISVLKSYFARKLSYLKAGNISPHAYNIQFPQYLPVTLLLNSLGSARLFYFVAKVNMHLIQIQLCCNTVRYLIIENTLLNIWIYFKM